MRIKNTDNDLNNEVDASVRCVIGYMEVTGLQQLRADDMRRHK